MPGGGPPKPVAEGLYCVGGALKWGWLSEGPYVDGPGAPPAFERLVGGPSARRPPIPCTSADNTSALNPAKASSISSLIDGEGALSGGAGDPNDEVAERGILAAPALAALTASPGAMIDM